jgi:hypothetical protein
MMMGLFYTNLTAADGRRVAQRWRIVKQLQRSPPKAELRDSELSS